jgi:hypothetical protein
MIARIAIAGWSSASADAVVVIIHEIFGSEPPKMAFVERDDMI